MTEQDDHGYFRSIETAFIRLRGAPFLLSPADWQVAQVWHREGIPVELVIEALEEVFERRAERGATGPVNGLRYCAAAVEAAWARRLELRAGADRADRGPDAYVLPVGRRLANLAAALPADLADRATWSRRITALDGGAEAVERQLADLDDALIATAIDGLGDDERERLAAAAERRLREVGDRVDDERRAAHSRRWFRDGVRRRLGLPLLSLFAPEARDTPGGNGGGVDGDE